ncbi:hypothetical protein L1987_27663 [Smallanthus sonchifolius]|uniref:Uncharacterized protein n=1 Tax=Smallanthus sonchifolius TaxID=185202 RepID=A0ACB9ICT8_9ASTR|nr:hypothetical protein L1987_27663 [Smallanthus sonchifolius]
MLIWLENFQIYKTKKRSYFLRLFLIYVGSWLSCKTHTFYKLQGIFMMEMKLKKEKVLSHLRLFIQLPCLINPSNKPRIQFKVQLAVQVVDY